MRQREDLRAYQNGAVKFIKLKKRCALFIDPGLGKTTTTLTAFGDLLADWVIGDTVLIVAPPRVAKQTWPREFAEWAHTHDRSFVYIAGTPEKRRKLLSRPADFHIISIDLLLWLLLELGGDMPRYTKAVAGSLIEEGGQIFLDNADGRVPAAENTFAVNVRGDVYAVRNGKIKKKRPNADGTPTMPGDEIRVPGSGWRQPPSMPYSGIVIDESSKVKNPDTTRWRALRQMAFLVEYFVELTGTPASNGLQDLWGQIYLIDGGERLGTSQEAFKSRWFEENHTGSGVRALKHAQTAIERALSDITFTLREEDYANLPPRMYNSIELEFDEKTLKLYRKFARSLVLEVGVNEKNITADSGATLTTKLLQLANGTVYRGENDGSKTEHTFHNLKLDAMADLVEELNGQNLFVAYQFKSDLARILKRFPQARVLDKKSSTQDEWNRGEIPILLAHPKSAAHGLNLQHGGNNILWWGPTYSLEDYIQFNKRLHRSGQLHPVMIHHLLIKGTIDEDVMAALGDKNDVQEALLNSLKSLTESYKDG